MSSPNRREIIGPSRWSRYGGRGIYPGQEPEPGQLVVTGWGRVSHKNLSCPALISGLNRAVTEGRGRSGFFAVALSLADTWVGRCHACLGDAALQAGEAPRQPRPVGSGAPRGMGRAAQLAAGSMNTGPVSRQEASATLCNVCGEPLTRGQRRADADDMPRHWLCLSEAERTRDRNTRLIESGVTFASRRGSTYRRGKGPGSFR